MSEEKIRITAEQTLSDNWYVLKKYSFELRRRDGSWQAQEREVYDRGNGATILLYNLERRTVLLTRQFRMPAFVNGHSGYLIETAAGLLDNASPEVRIRQEAQEETGCRVGEVQKVFDAFMSPGSVTERVHFFIGHYQAEDRIDEGGGLEHEGEDIEVLELDIDQALGMIKSGALGELAAMKHFLSRGYEVYTAVTDSSTYDIILAKNGQLLRVEVKTTAARTKNDKGWVVHLKRVRPNKTQNKIHPFDSSRIDLLAVYITPLDRVLIFEAKELQQRSALSILDAQLAATD